MTQILRPSALAALVLVVGTNLVIAAGVAYNRTGEPDARLVLTERELALPRFRTRGEDSGLALRLAPMLNEFRLDREQLRDLGFHVDLPPAKTETRRTRGTILPRRALVVLEFEGDSWMKWIARREAEIRELEGKVESGDATHKELRNARRRLRQNRESGSRLFVVDVGLDGPALRQTYKDRQRFVIVRGVVRMSYHYPKEEPVKIDGRVSEILARQIHVPLSLRPILDETIDERNRRRNRPRRNDLPEESRIEDLRPIYRATLAFGRRYEPILESVTALTKINESGGS